MELNPYSAPQTVIEIAEEPKAKQYFYVVSPKKFSILFLVTFGFYAVYWFYKQWHCYKLSTNKNVMPIMRAIFNIFFTHALLQRINDRLRSVDRTYSWDPTVIATSYVIANIAARISDKLSTNNIAVQLTSSLVIALVFIKWRLLHNAQKAANSACSDPKGLSNSKFTPANYGWIVIGVILWFVILLGLFVIFFSPEFSREAF